MHNAANCAGRRNIERFVSKTARQKIQKIEFYLLEMEARSDRGSPSQPSSNPIVVELSKPETLTDSERQLRLLGCLVLGSGYVRHLHEASCGSGEAQQYS